MIFNVEMLAFGRPNEIRDVEVPDNLVTDNTENDLELIFHYGQNDFQNKPHPSVSVGDVINYKNQKFVVTGIGFKPILQEEYNQYLSISPIDRHMLCFHYR